MSIKGFNVNGVTEQYDYNSLDNIPDIQGLPTGGTEGQVLVKTSGADYAVGWVNQTGGGGGGGSETDEIFWATRNVTTFAEVQEAVADGKLCAIKSGGTLSSDTYYLFYINDTRATFGNFSIVNSRISTLSLYSSNSWTYESLTIPEELTFDTTPRQYSNNPVRSYGIWNAIQAAKTTVDAALSATSENPVQNRSVYEALATKADVSSVEPFVQDAVDEWMETYAPIIGTLSNAAKRALLNCFAHVAWVDDQGQSYYNALESELFPDATLESITAVFTQGSAVIYDTDSLDTLRQYLTVTATYSDSTTATVTDYTLSGTLTDGTSTITANYGGKTDTFSVTVTHSDFTAVFTQGEATIWSDDSLDVLKQYLVVTLYGDEVSGYTLSGTLDSASSVITVSYNGHSTTFSVSVTLVGTTEYASELSNFTRVNTTGLNGYSDGVLWLKCSNSSQISSYASWVFDTKKTLWSAVNGKKLRIRFHASSSDWSGDQSPTNQIIHGVAIFSGPNVTSGSGRQKYIGLGNIAPTSSYQNYDYVLQADLSHITSGSGTPTSSSTFGVTVYSQSLHTVRYDSISVVEVLN